MLNGNTIGERIASAIEWCKDNYDPKMTQAKLARSMGVTSQAVYGWINTSKISRDNAADVAHILKVNASWLVTGKGSAYRLPNESGYYSLGESREDYEIDPRAEGKIPLISDVQAGESKLAIDNLAPGDAERWIPPPPVTHSDSTYALKVRGDSMERPYGKSYPAGCLIYVDPEQRGGVVVGDHIIAKISGEDAVNFKQLAEDGGRSFLKPLNPQYRSIHDEFRVLGRVIGKFEE